MKEMKEKCYRALRIIAEDWLESLFKERRQTRDLGERDRLTGKIEELQRILENLKEEKGGMKGEGGSPLIRISWRWPASLAGCPPPR